jgi:hypothetical protein
LQAAQDPQAGVKLQGQVAVFGQHGLAGGGVFLEKADDVGVDVGISGKKLGEVELSGCSRR